MSNRHRSRLWALLACGIFTLLLFLALPLLASTPDNRPSPPVDIMIETELRQRVRSLEAERAELLKQTRALQAEIEALINDIEILAQGHVSTWVREGAYAWAVFGEQRCFPAVQDVMLANECTGFVLYTEETGKAFDLQSGEIDWSEESSE